MKGDWLGRPVLRVPEWSRKRGQNWGQEEGEEDWGLYSKVSSLSFSSDLGFLGRGQAWCEGRDRIRTSLLCHKTTPLARDQKIEAARHAGGGGGREAVQRPRGEHG